MRLRNYSERTIKTYTGFIRRISEHYKITPDQITRSQVKDYCYYILEEQKLSPVNVNQMISAWKILQVDILGNPWESIRIKRPRMKRKLPVVLSQKEVTGLVHVLSNLKHRTILMLTYATGMRRDEVLNLKPSNIDSSRGVIRVSGKGQKVREIPIFDELLEQLRFYYKHYRPEKYLFEGKKRGKKYAQASWIFLIMLTPFPEAGSCDVFRMTFRRMLTPLSNN